MSCSGSGLFAILCFLVTTGICSELLLFRDCRLEVSDSHLASCMFSMDLKTWDEMSSVCGEEREVFLRMDFVIKMMAKISGCHCS